MSRPEKNIDWHKVDQLLLADCMGTEIAPHFDMHPETFYRRVEEKYGMGFTQYCAEKKKSGDSILRAKQYEHALKGNITMLIFLGKVRLKQREEDTKEIAPNESSLSDATALAKENHALREKLKIYEQHGS